MKVNIGELTETAMEQKMLAMTVNAGEKFSKAFVATQLMEGNITEEQAEKATSAIESSVATIEKGKEYNLDNKNNYILATLDLKLKAAKARAEAESDPMMKGIAENKVKKIEKQAQQLMETGNVDVALVTYPDGSFDILTHDEARLAMSKDEFMESFSSGDLKVEAMGESQAKLMSELQEKAKAMEPEAAPVEEKPIPRVFETPTDERYAVVNEGKGEGDRVLTRQEYDEYVAPAQEEKTKEDKLSKDKDRNERIEKALAILEPIASSREELTVDQLTEVSEILGEELAGELISDQISKAPDAVDLYNLLDDNKVKIDDTQTTEQEGVGTEEQVGEEGAGQVQEPEVSQEEGATDPVLQEEEEVESTTEEDLDAIDKELSDQGVVEGALTGRSRKRKVVKAVRNGIKAISKALPNVTIKLYETQAEFEEATGKKGNGYYNFKEKSISINLDTANARTVAHEIFHAFLLDKISTNEEAASISAKLFLELNKVEGNNAKLVKELSDFASMYEEEGIGVMTEEMLAEYLGKVAENYDSLSAKGKRAVREFVNSMLELIGKANPEYKEFLPSRVSGNEVVDMLLGIGERVAAGEVIEAEDVKLMDPDYLGLDIGDGTRSRAGNRQQLEELFLSDKKPKIKSLTDVAKFVESWAKDNTLFDKDIKDIPDDQIVKEFADHISAELIAWDKVRESEYVSFYDDDIKDRTNPTLQKYAMEEYGRPLTDSEVKLYHMVSSFASPSANPTFDSWKGFDIFDRWMKTGELSGYSDKMATEWEWTTSKTGKRVRKDTGIPKMDKEGNPVRSKVSPAYSQTGLDKFNLVLEKFNGDLEKTMDWFTSKHSYSEIAKMLDLPEKGSKAKKENEYISKEDGAIGVFGITGAKLGSYILNRFGNFSTVTKDMWYARTMARLAGEDLISVNDKTKKVGAIKTPWAESTKEGKRKRKLADKAFKIVADQRGTYPAMIQEQIWDFEKRLYEKLGAGEDASYTSDG
jgi:SHS2 domain-containing protein